MKFLQGTLVIDPPAPSGAATVDVFGVEMSTMPLGAVLHEFQTRRRSRQPGYVCLTSVHGIIEARDRPRFAQALRRAFLVLPDGKPLIWTARLQGRQVSQIRGIDLALAILAHSWPDPPPRHYFYGSTPLVLGRVSKRVTELGHEVVGVLSPPFRELMDDEFNEHIETMNAAEPDFVWIFLSTPKQEDFMYRASGSLTVPVTLGVGAVGEFLAGTAKVAPQWLTRIGLEWLYRLVHEPGRLWRRYARNNPRFALLLLGQILRSRAT